MSTHFGEIYVKGKTFQVHIDRSGQFVTSLEGDAVIQPSLEALRDKLVRRMSVKRMKVNIPFVMWDTSPWDEEQHKVRRGTITGIHADNHNPLITWETGEKDQGGRYRNDYLQFKSKDDEAKWIMLKNQARELRKQIDELEKKNYLDAGAEVDKILNANKQEETA